MRMLCNHRSVAQLSLTHTGSRLEPRHAPESARSVSKELHHGLRHITAQKIRVLYSCSAAPAAMETTSVSGRMAELKEQGR